MLGLGAARAVSRLSITWPSTPATQIFENISAGQSIEISEGSASIKVLKQPPLSPHALTCKMTRWRWGRGKAYFSTPRRQDEVCDHQIIFNDRYPVTFI